MPSTVLLAEDIMENNTDIVPAIMEAIFSLGRPLGAQDKEF